MRNQSGYTLAETAVTTSVVGILASTAAPQMLDIRDEAVEVSVKSTSGSFASAVRMAKYGWFAENHSGSAINIESFGNGDVDVNAKGYAVSTDDSLKVSVESCVDLFDGLLDSQYIVSSSSDSEDLDYLVSLENSRCNYSSVKSNGFKKIGFTYDASKGKVKFYKERIEG